jgi:hypothetical protein
LAPHSGGSGGNEAHRLQAELREIENRIAQARAEQSDSQLALLESSAVTAEALAALDSFKKAVTAECARLEGLAVSVRRRIAQQLAVVAAKRRDAKLLERLESKKLEAWTAGYWEEINRQAEEAYISRNHLLRNHRRAAGSTSRASQI